MTLKKRVDSAKVCGVLGQKRVNRCFFRWQVSAFFKIVGYVFKLFASKIACYLFKKQLSTMNTCVAKKPFIEYVIIP